MMRRWLRCSYLEDRRLLGKSALCLRWVKVLLALGWLRALRGCVDDGTATAWCWNRNRRVYTVVPNPRQRVFDPTGVEVGGAYSRKVDRSYSHPYVAITACPLLHSIGTIIYGQGSRKVCVVIDTSLLEVCLQICE